MTNESAQLLSDNINVAYKFFASYNIYDEDIRQDILFDLCRKIEGYNKDKGKLSTYIFHICSSSLKNTYRHKTAKCRDEMSINKVDILDKSNEYIEDYNSTLIDDVVTKIDTEILIDKAKNILSNVQYEVFEYKLKGYNVREIAKIMDCSTSYIYKCCNISSKKLRKEMIDYDNSRV